MAFYPAYCDNQCKGCEMNKCGWCSWKDCSTSDYNDWEEYRKPLKAETKYDIYMEATEHAQTTNKTRTD